MSLLLLVAALVCFLLEVLVGDAVVLGQNIQALDWVAGGLACWVASALVPQIPKRSG